MKKKSDNEKDIESNVGITYGAFLQFFALVAVIFMLTASVSYAVMASPVLWTTDENGEVKVEFSHNDTAYVAGEGFTSDSTVNIKVFEPDDTERCSGDVTADSLGAFDHTQFSCELNGKDGIYKVTADDGNGITAEYEFDEPSYTVESYSDSGHTTVDDDFVQGETVYGKGTRSSYNTIRLRFRNPSNTVVKTCPSVYGTVTTCSYDLPGGAPIGEWDIEIQRYLSYYGAVGILEAQTILMLLLHQ